MRIRQVLDSIPVRVGLALLVTAGLVLGVATLGSEPDPARWLSDLSQQGDVPEDAAELARLPGEPDERVTTVGADPAGNGGAPGVAPDPQTPGVSTDNGGAGQPAPAEPVAPSRPGEKAPDGEVNTVRLLWWNDTETSPPVRFELVLASSEWRPDNSRAASQTGSLARIPVGERLMLQIFPDGRNGKQIDVPVEVTAEMMDNSEEDAIHVAVSDTSVRVVGTPVVEFSVLYARR